MGLRWVNVVGVVMLVLALVVNKVVYLNVWHDSNLYLIAVAITYLVVALCLASWRGTDHLQA